MIDNVSLAFFGVLVLVLGPVCVLSICYFINKKYTDFNYWEDDSNDDK